MSAGTPSPTDDHAAALALIGVLASDPAAVVRLREFVEVATAARRDLLTARDADQIATVRQRRQLLAALWTVPASQTATDVRNDETVPAGGSASSDVVDMASVQEAAEVLEVTPRRVQQLLAGGQLAGQQDGPRRPWRVPIGTVHAYRDSKDDA